VLRLHTNFGKWALVPASHYRAERSNRQTRHAGHTKMTANGDVAAMTSVAPSVTALARAPSLERARESMLAVVRGDLPVGSRHAV
jgi:hypothetical protein